ncbi:hypothetical protein CAPTEDRAFT_167676 [Capitella teleta]|uniref:FZ domain-containing protein n=1 Tax=Capitella teleta TaxID=283909 RepID=R7VL55_CAPTE|nr:hypothetical protein CAPTEDRAFT_167676 [Capitella teleta]|eukprot:ELU17320.1 hypothetical protein CAPTEDRAFT_167676 [Capitella teleta]
MRLPNLLEHDSLREVTQQASSWVALTNVNCHPDTQLFLCSLFSPVCLDRPIPPCRNLCTAVRDACLGKMLSYGFPWPEMLRCDKFPLENDLCIGPQTENKPDESVCAACNHPKTFEAIVDAYCQADFVMRFKADEIVVSGSDLRVTANRRKKIFKKGSLKKRDLQQMVFFVEGGLRCDCKELEQAESRSGTDYIGMGQKVGDKLMLSFVQKYEKKDPGTKKAMRAVRKETICREGIKVITGEGSVVESKESDAQDEAEVVESITGKKKRSKKNKRREETPLEETPEVLSTTPQPEKKGTESNDASSSGRKSERKANRNRDREAKKRRSRDRSEDAEERRARRRRKQESA